MPIGKKAVKGIKSHDSPKPDSALSSSETNDQNARAGIREVLPGDVPVSLAGDSDPNSDYSSDHESLASESSASLASINSASGPKKAKKSAAMKYIVSDMSDESEHEKSDHTDNLDLDGSPDAPADNTGKRKIEFKKLVSEDEELQDIDGPNELPNGDMAGDRGRLVYKGPSNVSIAKANDIFGVTDSESDRENDNDDLQDIDSDFLVDTSDEEGDGKGTAKGKKEKPKKDEFAKPSHKPIAKDAPKVTIDQRFTPEEQEKNFTTPRQQIIALKDAPERFLTRDIPVQVPESPAELENEAYWIYQNLFCKNYITSAVKNKKSYESSVVIKIRNTLDLIRNQFLDIPFIAYYRTEFVAPELNVRDIWSIYDWDEKWCDLQNRKKVLLKICSMVQNFQYEMMSNISKDANDASILKFQPLSQNLIQSIENLTSFDEAESYSTYLMFYYGHIIKNPKASAASGSENSDSTQKLSINGHHKAPQYRTFYSICEENNITQLIRYFGITSLKLAENIIENFAVNEIEQINKELSVIAMDFVSEKFRTTDAVVECVINLAALEIGVEPKIVDYVRKCFKKNGLVTTIPTKKGINEIDDAHYCYKMKYIFEKPLNTFKESEFLELCVAENNGLLQIKFSLESESVKNSDLSFFKQMLNYYQKDEYSLIAQNWNNIREQVLFIAINQILMPKLCGEIKQKMLSEAQEALVNNFSRKMGNIINKSPFFVNGRVNDSSASSENPPNDDSFSLKSKQADNIAQSAEDIWSTAQDDASESRSEMNSIQSSKAGMESDSVLAPSQILRRMDAVPKIFSFTYSMENRSKAALITVLNVDGVFLDYLVLPNFQFTRNSAQSKIQLKAEDIKKVKDFIKTYEPKAIVIAANSRKASAFYKEFEVILGRMSDELDSAKDISLHFSDIRVSKLYQNSSMAEQEFPLIPQMARFSISIGRYFIDPLFELCRLFDPNDLQCSLMFLNLVPLQREIPAKEIHSLIDKMLVTKVNQLGVSISKLYAFSHKRDLLKFICGLGPCKQAMVYRKLDLIVASGKKLYSRADLINELNLGPYIFANCAGFLQFFNTNPRRARKKPHLISFYLDTTRVHPESYHWALKMALEALDMQEDDVKDIDSIFSKLKDESQKVNSLDLERYAEEIENNGFGNKSETLTNIKFELIAPFKDNRLPHKPLESDQLFELFNHDSLEMVKIGKIIIAKIIGFKYRQLNDIDKQSLNPLHDETNQVWMCGFCKESNFTDFDKVCVHVENNQCQGKMIGLRVMIDDQIPGFIPIENISDQYDVSPEELALINPKEKVKLHMVVHCRIIKLNPRFQELVLSCRSSDLQNLNGEFDNGKDEYHSETHKESLKSTINPQKIQNEENSILPRTIIHPKFRNIDFNGALKYLQDKPIGEFVFRPCRGKSDFLTLTWKVALPNILANISVEEKIKKNAASLGEVLMVENCAEKFDDLDEISAVVCHKLSEMAHEITNHQYYDDSINEPDEVERHLEERKALQPARVPYVFTLKQSIPGRVMLSYLPNRTVNHEYISLTARGLKFRSRYFSNLNHLVSWFKENFNNPKTIQTYHNTPADTPVSDNVSVGSRLTLLSTHEPSPDIDVASDRGAPPKTNQNITPFAMNTVGPNQISPALPPSTMSSQEFVTPQGTTYNTSMDLSMGTYGMVTPWEFAQHLSRGNVSMPQHMIGDTPGSFGQSSASQTSLTPHELYNQALYSQLQNNQFNQMVSATPNSINQPPYLDMNSFAAMAMGQTPNQTPNFMMGTPMSKMNGMGLTPQQNQNK